MTPIPIVVFNVKRLDKIMELIVDTAAQHTLPSSNSKLTFCLVLFTQHKLEVGELSD